MEEKDFSLAKLRQILYFGFCNECLLMMSSVRSGEMGQSLNGVTITPSLRFHLHAVNDRCVISMSRSNVNPSWGLSIDYEVTMLVHDLEALNHGSGFDQNFLKRLACLSRLSRAF